MSVFDELNKDIEEGINGKANFIPIGLPKLGKYANLRKNILTLVFSSSGAGKCFAPGTKVIMFDGSLKNVEDIKIGDLVMGIDSLPKTVMHVHSGNDEMYEIFQNKGESYIVNKEHILCLRKRRKKIDEYKEIAVKDFIKQPKYKQNQWKGYKLGVEFKEKKLTLDPYFLGLWLGDGTAGKPQITSNDKEIVEYLHYFANNNNLFIKTDGKYSYSFSPKKQLERVLKNGNKEIYSSVNDAAKKLNSFNWSISHTVGKKNRTSNNSKWNWIIKENYLFSFLKKNNLIKNKHIPKNYLINSRINRLKLLAGLIDSDGHFHKDKNGYEITQKNKELSYQIAFLCRSLGFYCSVKEKIAVLKRKNKEDYKCLVYRLHIYGETLGEIPCLLPRKKARNTIDKIINPLSTGINVTLLGIGEYYGFTLKESKLFFLEDFTVVHNSSFADTMILNACKDYLDSSVGKIKPDFQLFSMERAPKIRVAKWVSALIFLNEGIEIQLPKIMGWWDEKLSKTEHSLILKQKDYIDAITNDLVTIHGGAKTPNEIYKIMKDHYENNGEYDETVIKGKTTKLYIPNNTNVLTSIIVDHGNLTKTTKDLPSKKQAIDKLVEMIQGFRDLEGSNILWVSQINRGLANVTRKADEEMEPVLEDIKESGDIGDACDVAIGLFDPYKFKQSSKTGYSPSDFIDKKNGNNYFRSAHICKSSYGADNVKIPLAFLGFCGMFKEMDRRLDLSQKEYSELVENVLSKKYFFNESD